MDKVEHIGVLVRDLETSIALYTQILGCPPYKREEVESEGVSICFFQVGETKIELFQSTRPNRGLEDFLERRGEGLHHIAFAVDDIEAETKRLTEEGLKPLLLEPRPGADNKLVMFFHPKTANGVLLEICQERKDGHASEQV